ncbi:MAG: Gfo/Idh/MocA family oxidoreductase [Chloroflexi bacterium]|nr:Gfo/Idh/MocA family oxidoreductase [Chloroflexota bacterium]
MEEGLLRLGVPGQARRRGDEEILARAAELDDTLREQDHYIEGQMTMSKIRLAVVGCGGMGHRHLYGLAELQRAGLGRFELVGACDPVRQNAESLATQAEQYFGSRPTVAADLEELASLGIEAVDVTTTPRSHHTVVIEALQRGWHAMVEKPMGLTVRACNLMRRAAEASGTVLSVAENYRRDPMNRLVRALLDGGVIGTPRLLTQQYIGGDDRMAITVWRHQKNEGGVLLDVTVHYMDMLEYLCGEIETVYAHTKLYERTRKNPAAGGAGGEINPAGVYGRWQREMPAEFEATAEDAAYATLAFKNGAIGQYVEDHAGRGQGIWERRLYGSAGSMILPDDRSGKTISVTVAGQDEISGEKLLALAPDFHLDAATASLFGGDRLGSYAFPFPEVDRKLLAVEYADFAGAILGEHPAELGAEQGTRAVAGCYAMLESGKIGHAVTMEDVIAELVGDYQREINISLGI